MKTVEPTPDAILDTPISGFEPHYLTIGSLLVAVLEDVVVEGTRYNPANAADRRDAMEAGLVRAGVVCGEFDQAGELLAVDCATSERLIVQAIRSLYPRKTDES